MKQLLFLTDFSKTAENAYIYALSMAKSIGASVHILHIVPVIPTKNPEQEFTIHPVAKMVNDDVESMEWGRFRSESKVLEHIAQDGGFIDVPVEFHFKDGYFTEVVADFADEKDIDLIVVGTAGNNSFDKKLFGTHTEKLFGALDIPVMAVPAGAKYSVLKKFAVGVMMNSKEVAKVQQIAESLSAFGNHLQCVHIAKNNIDFQKSLVAKNLWLKHFKTGNISLDIKMDHDIMKGLKNYVAEEQIDMLCMIHRELTFIDRLFTRNFSVNMFSHSSTAVLIF